MNITNLNLNLLIALDALLNERHVTRASEKIFITQSALSNALNQLREIFQDPLLIRGQKGMIPTVKAMELQPQVRQILTQIDTMVNEEKIFDAKTSTRAFKIGMSDYTEFCILPTLLKRLTKETPDIELKISQLNRLDDQTPYLKNQIELGIGCSFSEELNLQSEDLFLFGGSIVARKNHPLMKKPITLKEYLSAKHIRVQYTDEPLLTRIDRALSELGYQRNVTLTMPHLLPVLFTLTNTDLIASLPNVIPKNLARKLNLAMLPLPFPLPDAHIKVAWHAQYNNDQGHRWLRNTIKEVCQKIEWE